MPPLLQHGPVADQEPPRQSGTIIYIFGTHRVDTSFLSVRREVVESDESFVIQGRWPDSRRGRRCGRPKTALNTIVTSCVIPAI